MKLRVKNTMPRVMFLPLKSGRKQLNPNDVHEVEESDLAELFKRQEKIMEHYRTTGGLVIVGDGKHWAPEGKQSVDPIDIAPIPASIPRQLEDASTIEESGVPGNGLKDCKRNVSQCDDIEQLNAWLEGENRSSVKKAIEARLQELG